MSRHRHRHDDADDDATDGGHEDDSDADSDSDDGAAWEILLAVFEEEAGAQSAVEAFGETFIKNASKARRRFGHAKAEDAVTLVVGEDGQLAVSDAEVLARKTVTGALGGIAVRMTLGLTLGGMINTVMTTRAYAGSRRRSKEQYSSTHPSFAEVMDQLDPGEALLVARCTVEELAGAADELTDAQAYGIWHAPEEQVVSALAADAPQDPDGADPAT